MFRKTIIFFGALLFTIITIALIVPSFINWDTYKGSLLQQINKYSDYKVTIDGSIRLALLPRPHLTVNDVSIESKIHTPAKSNDPLVRMQKLSLAIDFWPLLRKEISVRSIEFIQPIIMIDKQAESDNRNSSPSKENLAINDKNIPNNGKNLSLDISKISIINGLVIVTDPKEKKQTEIDSINLSGDFSFQNGFNLKAAANAFGIHFDGNIKGGAFVNGWPSTFDCSVDTIVGSLKLSGTCKDSVFAIKASSDAIKIPTHFQVGPQRIDLAKGLRFNTDLIVRDQIISLNTFKANIQDISLTGKGTYNLEKTSGSFVMSLTSALLNANGTVGIDLSQSKPMITADLMVPKIDDQDWQVENAPNSTQYGPANESKLVTSNERWSKDPINLSALQSINGDVNLAIKSLKLSDVDASNVKIHLMLNKGIAVLKNISANAFDGSLVLTGTLNSVTTQLVAETKVSNVNVVKIPGVKGSALKSGTLNFSGSFTTKALSVHSIVHQLNGNANLNVTKGAVEGVDIKQFISDLKITKDISGLSKLKESLDRKADIAFNHVRGDIKFTNGVARTDNFDIDLNEGVIASAGTIDLPNWLLALKSNLTVRNAKNIPSLSVNITGSIDHPEFGLDMNQLQKALIQLATNQLTDRAQDVVKKKVTEQLSGAIKGQAGDAVSGKVGGEVAKAVGKILPGLFG